MPDLKNQTPEQELVTVASNAPTAGAEHPQDSPHALRDQTDNYSSRRYTPIPSKHSDTCSPNTESDSPDRRDAHGPAVSSTSDANTNEGDKSKRTGMGAKGKEAGAKDDDSEEDDDPEDNHLEEFRFSFQQLQHNLRPTRPDVKSVDRQTMSRSLVASWADGCAKVRNNGKKGKKE